MKAKTQEVETTPQDQKVEDLKTKFKSQLEAYKEARAAYTAMRARVIRDLRYEARTTRELRAEMLETYKELKSVRVEKRVERLQALIEAAKAAQSA